MILSKEESEAAVKAELATGGKPRPLSTKYNIAYPTVCKWAREAKGISDHDLALELKDTNMDAVEQIVETLQETNTQVLGPATATILNKQLDEVANGASSLQLLDVAFHETIINLLGYANRKINDDMSMSDFKTIAHQTGELHSKLFSKGGTNVNIMQNNNQANTAALTKFKGGFRA